MFNSRTFPVTTRPQVGLRLAVSLVLTYMIFFLLTRRAWVRRWTSHSYNMPLVRTVAAPLPGEYRDRSDEVMTRNIPVFFSRNGYPQLSVGFITFCISIVV